jgi:hypothetical protein
MGQLSLYHSTVEYALCSSDEREGEGGVSWRMEHPLSFLAGDDGRQCVDVSIVIVSLLGRLSLSLSHSRRHTGHSFFSFLNISSKADEQSIPILLNLFRCNTL